MTEEKKCLAKECAHRRTSPFCDDCWTKRIDLLISRHEAEKKQIFEETEKSIDWRNGDGHICGDTWRQLKAKYLGKEAKA